MTTRSASRSRSSKPTRSRTVGAPGDELGAEGSERGAEPTGRARAGQARERRELVHPGQPTLEHRDGLGRRALLRPEQARGVGERRPHVAKDRRRHGELAEHLTQARAAVHGRASAEPDEERRGRLAQRREHQLAETSARGDERIALSRVEKRQPDRGRSLDHRPPVGQEEPAGHDRPPERIGDDAPRATRHRAPRESLGSALAAVGDRQLDSFALPHARALARAPPRQRAPQRTPLRLAGHSSALTGRLGSLVLELLDHLVHLLERILGGLLLLLHAPEHRERDALARDARCSPSAIPQAISIACSAIP